MCVNANSILICCHVVIDKKFTIVSKIEGDITNKLLKILDNQIKKIDVK